MKWFKDGIPISNDGNLLQLSNVTIEDQGIYSLTASNDYGSVTADLITLSVLVPLKIGNQSGNLDIIENQSISLGFSYSGSEPTEIKWFKDGNPIVGANSPTFIKHAATIEDTGVYSFTVTNELGTVEGVLIVVRVSKYIEPPSVTEFIASPNPALAGSQIVLSVAASGEGPFEFQWFYEDSLLATTELPLLSIDNVSSDNSGPYTVRVTNQAASAISDVVTLNVVTPVILDKSPEDVLVMERSPFELSVQASGSGDLTYSWFKDDQPIALPSTSTYSVESASFSDTGKYHVVISNGASSIQSTTASVLVTPYIEAPGIIIQPKNKRVHLGDPSSMVVSASGATPLNFQWFLNGEAIFGAVQSFYLIDSVSRDHVGTYTVSITNEAGSVTSNPASLNLIVPSEVLTQTSDVLVTSGDSFQLSVTLNTETIQESYWSKDGNKIEEASGLDYEVLSSSLSDAGNYTFHATDGTDWVQSNVIIVTVNQPPVFKSVPEDRSVVDGQRIMLQWIAQGTGNLTYELVLDGQVLDANNSGNFWVTPSGDKGNTEYIVKVSNAFGSITSDPVTVSLDQSKPEIIKQPRNIKLVQGEPLEMMIQASGGALKYQWYKGASQIPGATGATFRIAQTSASDAGDYFVVVSNNKGIVTSKPIKVGFGVKVAVEINGANLVLKMNPGNSHAQWKLQKSSNLLFWQDVQDLTGEDLNGLVKPIGTNTEFYRVVEK